MIAEPLTALWVLTGSSGGCMATDCRSADITVNGTQLSEMCRLQAPGLLHAGQGSSAS